MKRIVALVDFSDRTSDVVRQSEIMARAFGAQVTLLHVVPPKPVVIDFGVATAMATQRPGPETIRAHQDSLGQLLESLKAAGIQATAQQLDGPTVASIVEESRRLGADLIIMGAHPHSAFYDLLVGSISREVLKDVHCPVLVLPDRSGVATG